ncbi:MAG: hypothetical protein M3O31_05500 [Acidobacteriota bacterium]|nr:hypothetical protein [Acidobacteriota bacterium]
MQNAKDTFYITLQSRLAALNPARTLVLRGVTRPGTLVDENELPTAFVAMDAFRLQWTRLRVNASPIPIPIPLIGMECAIHYATDGNPGSGGMDRGRTLASMDAELSAALAAEPHAVPKMNYSTTPPTEMTTNIFWADPVFGEVTTTGERLARTATVQVFSYQEAGEL